MNLYDPAGRGDDVALHDVQMLEEIELLGELMVMASDAAHPLSQSEIDNALGVGSAPRYLPDGAALGW